MVIEEMNTHRIFQLTLFQHFFWNHAEPVVLNSGRTSTWLREPTTNPGLATPSEILPLWAWVLAGRSTEMRTAI